MSPVYLIIKTLPFLLLQQLFFRLQLPHKMKNTLACILAALRVALTIQGSTSFGFLNWGFWAFYFQVLLSCCNMFALLNSNNLTEKFILKLKWTILKTYSAPIHVSANKRTMNKWLSEDTYILKTQLQNIIMSTI